jgi:hypothetical protein
MNADLIGVHLRSSAGYGADFATTWGYRVITGRCGQ